jgi:hypothetical protein
LLGALTWPALYLTGDAHEAARALAAAFAVSGVAALLGGLCLHILPSHDRRTKYNALLGGQALLNWGLLLYYYPGAFRQGGQVALALTAALLLLPQALLFHQLVRPDIEASDARGWRRALTCYRVGMWAGPTIGGRSLLAFLLSRLVDPTGCGFLLLRYFATEKLLRSKVLYVRAFRDPQSEALASLVVAPLSKRVVVEAWVHERPSEGALYRQIKQGLRVRCVSADDADWQLWFEQELKRSLAVIVDASAEGTNVSYELKLALQLVPRERIVVLLPEGMREPRSGLASITYDAGSPEQAARPLAAWLAQVVESWRPARRDFG